MGKPDGTWRFVMSALQFQLMELVAATSRRLSLLPPLAIKVDAYGTSGQSLYLTDQQVYCCLRYFLSHEA